MPDAEKVILFPRYTSFVGPGVYYSPAMNVRDYLRADVSFWRGNEIGTLFALNVTTEQSPDLTCWSNLATFTTTADLEDLQSMDLTMDWFHLKLVVVQSGGNTPALTCWAVANLQRRDIGGATGHERE